jgi:hypothetical protein
MNPTWASSPAEKARFIQAQLPPGGLFAGQEWRISPDPFPLEERIVGEMEMMGRVLLQFYRAANLLYRQSLAAKEPSWVARWLDLGKPAELLEWQRSPALKNEVPRVIRPDLLLTDSGLAITELDSVPGGIGMTAWLNRVYSSFDRPDEKSGSSTNERHPIIGGADAMLRGFEGMFGNAAQVHIVVSEESATYRPEMEWLSGQLGEERFQVRGTEFTGFATGDAVYRFFELYDFPQVHNAKSIFDLAVQKQIRVTPPPKPLFEEKMLFALLWNRNLRGFWRRELGERFFERLLALAPYTWLLDPTPLPPHGAIPELNLTDWRQLEGLSQRERDLILKISGFNETAWGARGVYLGSDLSTAEWSEAVELALRTFEHSPFVLQRYHHPKIVNSQWFDFTKNEPVRMPGRVRLCPFYFVAGDGDAARANLGGVLATICPADKKIIHGMKEAILAPCSYELH